MATTHEPQPACEQLLVEIVDSLTTTLHSLDEIVFVLDAEGRFIDFHSPAEQPLLMAPGDFLGKRYDEALPPGLAIPLAAAIASALTP